MSVSAFEPPISQLSSLSSNIALSLQAYEAAQSPSEKENALQVIAQCSKRLANAATDPADAFSDFTFQPLANACVRIAISMGLFEQLPPAEALSIEDIAKLTKAELSLTMRVVRVLTAFDILAEDGHGLYSHTPLSRSYADKSSRAWATWMWDMMINASGDIGSYFDEHALKSPTDAKDSPFSWARNEKGVDIFEIVRKSGRLRLFNDAMSGSSAICAKEAVATYDFGRLVPGEEDVLIVDVGGNKGQTIKEIRFAYPLLKGRMIVQDLKAVVDGGLIPGADAQSQAYDFFEQVEPVRGAAAYFYQRIFHDWSDGNCQKILQNLRPAMSPSSKLLICDVVVPDHRPHPRKVLRDMNMLLVGGMERSEAQWHDLLEGEGFAIEEIHGLQNSNNSIIEAVLK